MKQLYKNPLAVLHSALMLVGIFLMFASQTVSASHFRGGTWVSSNTDNAGTFTGILESNWRKGMADAFVTVSAYDPTDATRTNSLLSQAFSNPITDTSDVDFNVTQAAVSLDLSGLPGTEYVLRWQNCCRVSTITNGVADGDYALETVSVRGGNAPTIASSPSIRIAIGLEFSQNINATELDGDLPLSYTFLTNTGAPDLGAPAIPGLTLSNTGLLSMSAAASAAFNDGDLYVAKTRVSDTSGATSDRDITFIFQTSNNNLPTIDSITGGSPQSVQVGQTLNFTVTARDVDAIQLIALSSTGLPTNSSFTPNAAANPVSGTFSFTPSLAQAGQTFGINFDATDNDIFPLTASTNIQIQVAQNATAGAATIPTLSGWALILLCALLLLPALRQGRQI